MVDNSDNDLLDLDEEDYDTVLAPDIEFSGKIHFEEPFMIKGTVSGLIDASSDLLIDEGATVNADIHASRIIIKGAVVGNVTADKMVHVFSSGKLTGDVTAPEVVLESGCYFTGICTMNRPGS
ncbi:polymer-forming cytoskeletal protein [Treponema zuelzerae]|mgnify:CR=1 FL=1|jgi:cytoskeletal protein CcmA (bactofilin family)|uniref:Polymer-forming cytoskeletal protein n=1 Tax=Teretinema zuelzerae TaxID=156 RepID=A0AAE3JHA8_9SPIR|nr:polymer-forming cytoskeletal protein [Teretinema zuelzerae]MBN2810765.1 polymer-forming cytoskeletal protein [Spirochaetales bacterium]MCD1653502.1 polymer-forming cytoskeletal protein [Teretinema zuelzerae]